MRARVGLRIRGLQLHPRARTLAARLGGVSSRGAVPGAQARATAPGGILYWGIPSVRAATPGLVVTQPFDPTPCGRERGT